MHGEFDSLKGLTHYITVSWHGLLAEVWGNDKWNHNPRLNVVASFENSNPHGLNNISQRNW